MDKENQQNPIRILHVVGGMNRGGVETWLMHILRNIDRQKFQIDFLVHTDKPCAYDEEIRALGSQIIPCLEPAKPWVYGRNFQQIVNKYGPYQIVHSHVHHFSGYVLYLAKKAGIPVRIAHSHNNTSSQDKGLYRQFYRYLTEVLINHNANLGLGCSQPAMVDLFGRHWQKDPRWQLLYCGIDITPFRESIDDKSIRYELGIPENGFVIGHVGRFEQQKNHDFLIDIAVEVIKQEPKAYFLLIGDGSLRLNIEKKVIDLGLKDHVIFAGVRSDIARLMNAMDVFLFPSLHEGLGLVLIEAQAAGLPCIFSDVIPDEADLVKPLIQRISRSQSVFTWAKAVVAARYSTSVITRTDALNIVQNSPFNIQMGVAKLTEIYQSSFSN